jgi:hypothetical protein
MIRSWRVDNERAARVVRGRRRRRLPAVYSVEQTDDSFQKAKQPSNWTAAILRSIGASLVRSDEEFDDWASINRGTHD